MIMKFDIDITEKALATKREVVKETWIDKLKKQNQTKVQALN